MPTISQVETADDCAAVSSLVQEFFAWAATLDPDVENADTFKDLKAELADLPGIYGPPTGAFLLARDAGQPVGCVAFRQLDEAVVELKRMYVRPDQRGKGTGANLVDALIAEAKARGASRMDLSSFHTMVGAHKIYRDRGFKDVDPPSGFPVEYLGRVVFMELDLT